MKPKESVQDEPRVEPVVSQGGQDEQDVLDSAKNVDPPSESDRLKDEL